MTRRTPTGADHVCQPVEVIDGLGLMLCFECRTLYIALRQLTYQQVNEARVLILERQEREAAS